jgi:hypothetical protein
VCYIQDTILNKEDNMAELLIAERDISGDVAPLGKLTVLEALATETVDISPYSSRITSISGSADFDD